MHYIYIVVALLGIWPSYLTDLLSPRLIRAVEAKINVRNSYNGARCCLNSDAGSHGCKPSSLND